MENQKMLSTQEPVVGGTENTLILGFSRHRFSRGFSRGNAARIAPSSMPSTSRTFAGELWPLTTAMLEASVLRRSASRATTASVARPMRTFRDQAQRKTTRDLGLRPPQRSELRPRV